MTKEEIEKLVQDEIDALKRERPDERTPLMPAETERN